MKEKNIMKIKTEKQNALSWTLSLEGRLDVDGAEAVHAALAAIPDSAERIIIDCGELEYASLAGLRELLIARRRFSDGVMRLENVRPRVMEALETTGFRDFFEITGAEEKPVYMRLSFREFLNHKRCETGERVAIVTDAGSHTWREIDACAEVIAADLAKRGVRRGSHVAI